MGKTPGLLATLRHRDWALFLAAFTTSAVGSWAYGVALAVWLIDRTGQPGWVAVATVGRFVPALLFSAYGGVVAERFERVRLMMVVDLACAVVMVVLAAEMAAGAAPAVVVLTAAGSSTLGTIYEPAIAALTPQLVSERDLGSANALRNTVDNVCVIAGPGIGALLLVVGQPWLAVGVNGLTFLASALLVSRIRIRSTPVDVTEGGRVGPLRQMLVGITTIGKSGTTATLVAFSIVATSVFGIDTVLFVVLSRDVLGTGAEGYGYLLAGLGVGGVLAAGLVTRMEKLPRLGAVIWLGMAAYCLPTLLFLHIHQPAIGFVVECFRGAATLVVDVLAMSAMQRSLPSDLLGRVFGAFNALMLLAILAGSLLVPLVLSLAGLTFMVWFAGAGIPVLCLLGAPWLRQMDLEIAARRAALAPKTRLLAGCDLLNIVGEGSLDQLAGSADFHDVAEGTLVLVQGETPNAFYAIDTGTFVATATAPDGTARLAPQTMGPGDYFGEIGLIENIPRTATVTAVTTGRLLEVDGKALLEALTQGAPSAALVDGSALRLSRTHPTREARLAGLTNPA